MEKMEIENKVSEFHCFCEQKIQSIPFNILKEHLINCPKYKEGSPFHKIFCKIPFDNLEIEQTAALYAEMIMYKKNLENILSSKKKEIKEKDLPELELDKKCFLFLFLFRYSSTNAPDIDFKIFSGDLIYCQHFKCRKGFVSTDIDKIWYVEPCLHIICRACLAKAINTEYVKTSGTVKCLVDNCNTQIQHWQLKEIAGEEKLIQLESKLMEDLEKQANIVSCCKCKEKIEFEKGNVEKNLKDEHGKPLTAEQAVHYADNRFTCPSCKTEQCRSCSQTPYHMGFTCEQYKTKLNSKNCRYCDEVIIKVDLKLPLYLQDICKQKECLDKAKNACQKMHPCGHPCSGYKDELNCLDCIFDECAEKKKLSQIGSEYCNICFVEGLVQAPCIQLKCQHIFHLHCIQKRLDIKWHSPRIIFSFCLCPLCKVWMEFPLDSILQINMAENFHLLEKIKKMSLERLKYEARDKDERLTKVGDPYYNKPMDYALAIFSYYMCFKCKNPFFGGLKSCENLMAEEKDQKEFDPKELVCANCCDVLPIENCPKHGKDYVEFKCRFCCSVAQWFCSGTTHFCDPCHRKAGEMWKKKAKDLKQCKGPQAGCPLGIHHKPNGEEFALGCSLCRSFKGSGNKF